VNSKWIESAIGVSHPAAGGFIRGWNNSLFSRRSPGEHAVGCTASTVPRPIRPANCGTGRRHNTELKLLTKVGGVLTKRCQTRYRCWCESGRESWRVIPLRGLLHVRTPRYSPELRERAVRMVSDQREDYKSEWAAVSAIAKLLGMSPETLRTWVRRAQVDGGTRPGLSTDGRARLKQLEREVKGLRRANASCRTRRFSSRLRSTIKPRVVRYIDARRLDGGSSRSAKPCSSPFDVLRRQVPAAVCALTSRRGAQGRDPTGPR